MLLSSFLLVALTAATTQAQSLVSVLQNQTGATNVSTLIGLVTQANLLTSLGAANNMTLLAPVNTAFARLPPGFPVGNVAVVTDVLMYHVGTSVLNPSGNVSDAFYLNTLRTSSRNLGRPSVIACYYNGTSRAFIFSNGYNATNVIRTQTFTGGVVHFIDEVLFPPVNISTTARRQGAVGISTALDTVGITNAVDGLQGYTAFVPIDSAFAAVANVAAGLTPVQMQGVLAYHLVPGVFYSKDVFNALQNATASGLSLPTYLNGQNINVTMTNGTSSGQSPVIRGPGNTRGAEIVAVDIMIENGVVHLIDQVLLPDVTRILSAPSLAQIGGTAAATTTGATTSGATAPPTTTAGASTSTKTGAASPNVRGEMLVAGLVVAVGAAIVGAL
ncbi:hypothetical protein HDU67_010026 [Dinochytrium kinnereticum]|nr:hypothetical protein HDU67_010026 [Dinochytrium kinnereticum]